MIMKAAAALLGVVLALIVPWHQYIFAFVVGAADTALPTTTRVHASIIVRSQQVAVLRCSSNNYREGLIEWL